MFLFYLEELLNIFKVIVQQVLNFKEQLLCEVGWIKVTKNTDVFFMK